MFSYHRFVWYVLKTLKLIIEPVTSSSFHLRKMNVKFMLQNQQFFYWRNVKQGQIDGHLKKQWTWEHILKMLLIEGLWVKVLCCKVIKAFIKNGFFDGSLVHGLKWKKTENSVLNITQLTTNLQDHYGTLLQLSWWPQLCVILHIPASWGPSFSHPHTTHVLGPNNPSVSRDWSHTEKWIRSWLF